MRLNRKTIEKDEEYLRQISTEVNFDTDDYIGYIEALKEYCKNMDYVGTVDRPYSVEVEYYDIKGEKKHEIFEGFKATVFCHEFDHLNGILHIDLADDVRQMTWDETKIYREQHPYQVLSKSDEYIIEKSLALIRKQP